jgi:hypothetical protein
MSARERIAVRAVGVSISNGSDELGPVGGQMRSIPARTGDLELKLFQKPRQPCQTARLAWKWCQG